MNRSIEQALVGLVPTLSVIPHELIELSTSLLAQSRTRASNLKAEEEIARSYACANIACERLKQSLDLPKIEPRPPCPPRLYQKLYKYLERTLPAHTQASGRTPSSTAKSKQLSTPTKSKAPSALKPQQLLTPRGKRVQHAANGFETPSWIMPVVRKLCVALGAPAAPAHVLAGVSSVLTLPAPKYEEKHLEPSNSIEKILALIIAVLFYVTTKLSGKETRADEYSKEREVALEALTQITMDIGLERDYMEGKDVDDWMRQISAGGWLGLDWFQNISQGAGLGLPASDGDAEDEANTAEKGVSMQRFSGDSSAKKDNLQSGLGTMIQDRFNYLSEDKRLDYLQWKKDIILRIEKLEREQAMDTNQNGTVEN